MDAMTGGAVGNCLAAGARLEAVVAVCETGDAVGRQSVAHIQAFVTVTTAARRIRDARRIDERLGILGREDIVLAVTIRADRGIARAAQDGLAVDALVVSFLDFGVARAAGRRNVPVIDF